MKLQGKTIAIYSAFLIIAFSVGLGMESAMPEIKRWVLTQIELQSKKHLPAIVRAQSVRIGFFPPVVNFQNVDVTPKGKVAQYLAPAQIQSVDIRLSWPELLQGKLRISTVRIDRPKIVVIAKKQSDTKFKMPDFNILKILEKIPINSVQVEDLDLMTRIDELNLLAKMDVVDLLIENRYQIAYLYVLAPSSYIKQKDQDSTIQIGSEAKVFLEENKLTISAWRLRKGKSSLILAGDVTGNIEKGDFKQINLKLKTTLQFNEMMNWAAKTFPQQKLPRMAGKAELEMAFSRKNNGPRQVAFSARTENLEVEQIKLGQLLTHGDLQEENLSLSLLKVQNDAGEVSLHDLKTKLDDELRFETTVRGNKLEIGKFLQHIGLKEVPLYSLTNGEFKCSGQVKPSPLANCQGTMHGRDIHVFNLDSKNTILKIQDMRALGQVSASNKEVKVTTDLIVGGSKGKVSGFVNYENGFRFDFQTEQLDFKDVENLSNLKTEGRVKIKGTTEGNSHTATFGFEASGQDLWLEDFGLGRMQTQVQYKSGVMQFRNINGSFGASRYSGQVALNFPKNELEVVGKVPFVEARDLLEILSRKFKMPVPATGSGSADIQVRGPFRFNELTYKLRSSLFRGSVADEPYDQIIFNLSSQNGNVRAERVQMNHGTSSIVMTGNGYPNGNVDLRIAGRSFRLEESENISRLGLNISGDLNFDMSIKGHVLRPEMVLKGELSQVMVREEIAQNSKFTLRFTPEIIEGQGKLFGDVINGEFKFPISNEAPFLLKAKTKNWNFSQMFSLLSSSQTYKQFVTNLTSTIDLKAESGGFWNSSGTVKIDNLEISRGPIKLTNPRTMNVVFNNGRINSSDFLLRGAESSLRLDFSGATREKFLTNLNAKIDLSLTALFLPFLEDIRGQGELGIQTTGPITKLSLTGNARILDGMIKVNEFPHPFEKVQITSVLSQQRITFNKISAILGGGNLNAQGDIVIGGSQNFPVQIQGDFQNVNLNLPDQFRTRGSGSFSIRGNWFPYLLAGKYAVSRGEVTREFTSEEKGPERVRPSTYLPQAAAKERFAPLRFDLAVSTINEVRVRNSLADTPVRGNLSILGTTEAPQLQGSLSAPEGGKIFFRENAFDIISGNVQFNGPPDNPSIYLSARSRVQDYDISLIAQGKAQDPLYNMTSQPPLPQSDIISLLALGVINTQQPGNRDDSNQKSNQTGYQIGSAILQKLPIGKEIKSRFGADVQFGSSYNTNDPDSVAEPTLSVKKDINSKLSAKYKKTFGKSTNSEDYKLEYKFSPKLFLTGGYEKRDQLSTESTENRDTSSNILGLDLEYKFEFK